MSYDHNEEVPLKGEELKVAKRIQKIIEKLKDFERSYPWFSVGIASIHIDFAMRGVRCNGHERRNSFAEVIENFGTLKDSLTDTAERIEKSLELVNEVQGIYSSRYKRCPKCGGKAGRNYKSGHILNAWEDCYECDGYGHVLIPIPEHIPKVQHKLYKKMKERR